MFANYFDQPIKKDEQPRLNTGEITKKLTILKACVITPITKLQNPLENYIFSHNSSKDYISI